MFYVVIRTVKNWGLTFIAQMESVMLIPYVRGKIANTT